MIKRVTIGDLRLTFTAAHVSVVEGFNSELEDGYHILMWDFDNTNLEAVKEALRKVQIRYFLPRIRIMESKQDTNYMAICLKRLPWRRVVEILAQTGELDWQFFRFGVYRGKFTLRLTPKGTRAIKYKTSIEGYDWEDVSLDDFYSWVRYETLNR